MFKRYLKGDVFLKEALMLAPPLLYNLFLLAFNKVNFYGPIFLTWNLTYQCQLKCKHCLIEPESFSLSRKDRVKLAKNIVKSPVHCVLLSGGEPLMVSGVVDILKILKKHRKKIIIATNGVILGDFADDLINLRLDALHISMDSHRKEVHDYLRNCPGLFDKVLKTIAEIKAKRSSKKPLIRLRCTLSKANYLEMVEYVDFWRDKVDSIHFQPILNNRISIVREESLMFTKQDDKMFRQKLSELQKKYQVFRGSYYTLMPDYIFNRQKLYEKLKYKCLLMSSSGLYLSPDGCVALCDSVNRDSYGVGNLLSEEVTKVWKKKRIIKTRKNILGMSPEVFCSDCFCWCSSTQFNIYFLRLYNFLAGRC